jgi:Ku protein
LDALHTVWKGNFQVSLVSVPIRLVSIENRDYLPYLHYSHDKCKSRVDTVRRCKECGEEIKWNEMGRITDSGVYISPSELNMTHDNNKVVEIENIFSYNELPQDIFLHIEKSYLVVNDPKLDSKPYKLLWKVLSEDSLACMGTITLKSTSNEKVCMISANEDGMFLQILSYYDQIKHDAIKEGRLNLEDIKLSKEEISVGKKLIRSLEMPSLDVNKFKKLEDRKRERLLNLVNNGAKPSVSKVTKKAVLKPDLLEQLKASVESAKNDK